MCIKYCLNKYIYLSIIDIFMYYRDIFKRNKRINLILLAMELNDLINKIHKTIEAKEIDSISQKDMAGSIGVAPRTYTEYTRGTNKPLAMKAILNLLSKLDNDDIVKMVRLWQRENNNE